MINNKIIYAVGGFVLLIIIISLVGIGGNSGQLPQTAGGAFYIKPELQILNPGDMIAILLTVENNAQENQTMYYNFGINPVRTDSGEYLSDFEKWVIMENDVSEIEPGKYVFKDAVISVPDDAKLGEHVYHVYSCYADSPEKLGKCDRNSNNIWAGPITLTIVVKD